MDKKQDKLRTFILELSANSIEIDLDEKIKTLKDIYIDDFQHYYSEIFATITIIKNDENYDLQTLLENINRIFEEVAKDRRSNKKFFRKVKKLYDHINLDVSRIEYTEQLIEQANQQNKITKDELKKVNQRANKMQKDYVTILGIFAAIIIAFVSGMVFSTSVLNNIDKVNIYRMFFVMALVALFLFNLINLLITFIKQINGRETSLASFSALWNPPFNIISLVNTTLILAVILDIILWLIYWYRML